MNKIISYATKKEKILIALTIIFIICVTATDASQPFIFQKIASSLTNTDFKAEMINILKWSSAMIGLVLTGVIFNLLAVFSISAASTSIVANVRSILFKKILSFSSEDIDKFGISSLVVRTSNDMLQIREAIYDTFTYIIRGPLFIILGFIFSMINIAPFNKGMSGLDYSQYQFALAFLVIPIFAVIIIISVSISRKNIRKQRQLMDKNNQIMLENLMGAQVVRAFNLQQDQENQFNILNNSLKNVSRKSESAVQILQPIVMFGMNLSLVIIILVFAKLASHHGSNPDKLVSLQIAMQTFMQFFTLILIGLILVTSSMFIIIRAKPAARRVNEVLDTQVKITSGNSESLIDFPSIEFKNVYFNYNEVTNDSYTLNNLNFKINPGQTIGIIGPTGSGKTSLVNLIMRFYDADKGEILINNENIKNYKIDVLKNNISCAFQEKILFQGTIKSNIMVGKTDASDAEILEAAKNAEAYEYILNMSDKFNSNVDQGGSNLSGGQKQRLSIARALIKKAKILIFDDSLSALDNITEGKILNNIKSKYKGTTLIIVAQRIKSIQSADSIIVMETGKILDIGNHEFLLKSNKLYKDIWESQNTEIGG
ncbi:MAG: ABC transporter ATP-binding protein [Mycoplasmoidaceae bacterium]